MGKNSVMNDKVFRLKKYNPRVEIERLLDLDSKPFLKKILAEQDAKLIAQEEEYKRIGYCDTCHQAMTTSGICSNALCYTNQPEKKPVVSTSVVLSEENDFSEVEGVDIF